MSFQLDLILAVFRIQMDPGFFAYPDSDLKNPDQDPSDFFALIYSKSSHENLYNFFLNLD